MPIHPFYWTDDDSLLRVQDGYVMVPRFEIIHKGSKLVTFIYFELAYKAFPRF